MYSLLDLSNNKISGEIPTSLGNLKSLKVLNISNNNISGHIPVSFGNLTGIESLDLSHNKISGSIPESLEKLDGLGILDVSNNRLIGKIPMGGHKSTMNGLKYFANNSGLCGMQINITCPNDITPSEGTQEAEDDEQLSWIFWVGTWIGFPIGFFSSILIMGHFLNFLLFKAAAAVRAELVVVVKEKKKALVKGVSIGARYIVAYDCCERRHRKMYAGETEIANEIMGLIVAGYSTVATVMTFFIKCVGLNPGIYDKIQTGK
ncbi:hypothetical protein OSB04_un001083 [Centaurea solstitialis]|uniref:Uncharacterized protein n=1 Tax=Centaurea solstitialis TaxID=347529 RepID=A0AA38S2V5_9ASTR|nr:hypothetical protein OSB04_un001083 [Centaurea solstitialis]